MITTQLSKIGDVSARYGISSRTLRYYEEIGLLASSREPNTSKRLYSPEMLTRLELILLLKQLSFSVKDIAEVLLSEDRSTTTRVFGRKLKEVQRELGMMQSLQQLLQRYVDVMQAAGQPQSHAGAESIRLLLDAAQAISLEVAEGNSEDEMNTEMEASNDMEQTVKLADDQVRYLELKPMKVAYYQTTAGQQPEDEAWNVLYAWVKDNELDQSPATRYFGFNSPGEQGEHGYEMWATVPEDAEPSGEVRIKQVEGGLYAVSSLYGLDIPVAWKRLNEWVQSSNYQPGAHQWLEEHFLFNGDMIVNETFQLDLYYPIAVKS
ncbi:hypothetical protein PA598K_03955 [Paenibacillus sp. 598K]|uniref:effector binding domain-containing protein n=1 Tax=Paenibacillus sp. 598K TaxID=1117987 RepID=UPI000FFAB870|nr:effector binding domain-containing protein [Paenibacillus sp. 598K]GBF75538.1 hypothetical protein PA598K_03955 [Paenibacillus sp. 598K]